MGYKITKFDFDKVVTLELLDYLSTNVNNIQQKVDQFLYPT
jgi:hypothetical protein